MDYKKKNWTNCLKSSNKPPFRKIKYTNFEEMEFVVRELPKITSFFL